MSPPTVLLEGIYVPSSGFACSGGGVTGLYFTSCCNYLELMCLGCCACHLFLRLECKFDNQLIKCIDSGDGRNGNGAPMKCRDCNDENK